MKKLFGLIRSLASPRAKTFDALCQPDVPVQIIGDIHGRMDLLATLEPQLDGDTQVVAVGDYIDRGDQSRDVLAYLIEKTAQSDQPWVCLRGNHEEMMLNFLDDPEQAGRRWLRYGGLQTLASYGIGGITETASGTQLKETCDQLRAKLPSGTEDWLRRLPLTWQSGNLWIVHAAADPTMAMTEQSRDVLVWGHPDFLTRLRGDNIWVAHGHTVVDAASSESGRIATDTGAYFTNRLTVARCDPSGMISFADSLQERHGSSRE